jgi:glycosyltransferase involved in cell wall biosynthesis
MRSSAGSAGVVVYRRTGGDGEIDAIDEYSRRLVAALAALGMEARYEPGGLAAVLAAERAPAWILLQYNPFRFGRWGFAPGLVRDALTLRRAGVPLAIMVHEAWVGMTDWRTSLMGLWQRAQLRAALRLADSVMTSTEALAREIGRDAVHVPIATNITPVPTSREAARERLGLGSGLDLDGRLAIALFGRAHPSRAIDHAEAAIGALARAHGTERLAVMNLGADAPPLKVAAGVEVHTPGVLASDELSLRLHASDLVLLPLTDGLSTRRGTLMAALAHGRPVVGLLGHNTDAVLAEARDALALTAVGDRSGYARAAVELSADPGRLRAIGAAGLRLYESRFDWPVIARRVRAQIETLIAPGREIVFVAHDVGGPGGMERQSEQLVERVLQHGRRVTVVARTCTVAPRPGLSFVRVHTPSRPFSLAYPAFFAVASAIVATRRKALLHTTGAVVANRVDLATVHYCHRAAALSVRGSRASRPGTLYRVNAAVARAMSLGAEAWCYRPARVRLLCAVSGGVASELEREFPAMANRLRTVANGVDCAAFRPDRVRRQEVRTELGLDERVPLMLFVGGDWERKGLAHAIDALALAPAWHLAVAGAGDSAPYAARARRAGTERRVQFLGLVRSMARLYAAGDALVLPTAYEAFPLVALEAAASGLPLLVTRVNGTEDLVSDGVGGWFIAPEPEEIARRLAELASSPQLARGMAAASRAAATGYSWEAMGDGYAALYAELDAEGDSP